MVAPVNKERLVELEKLVESIKQGQRVVIFPPGCFSFAVVNVLLIFSFVTLFAPILSIISSNWEVGKQAIVQLASIPVFTVCIVPPAFLITRGRKGFQRWFVLLSSALALIAALTVCLGLLMDIKAIQYQAPSLYVSIIISSLTAFIAQSDNYRLFAHFYYLLHKKHE